MGIHDKRCDLDCKKYASFNDDERCDEEARKVVHSAQVGVPPKVTQVSIQSALGHYLRPSEF